MISPFILFYALIGISRASFCTDLNQKSKCELQSDQLMAELAKVVGDTCPPTGTLIYRLGSSAGHRTYPSLSDPECRKFLFCKFTDHGKPGQQKQCPERYRIELVSSVCVQKDLIPCNPNPVRTCEEGNSTIENVDHHYFLSGNSYPGKLVCNDCRIIILRY